MTENSMKTILQGKLTKALDPEVLEIMDDSARHAGHSGARLEGETHWRIKIISAQFEGLSRLQRHQLVYQVLKDEMREKIHALTLKTLAPGEE